MGLTCLKKWSPFFCFGTQSDIFWPKPDPADEDQRKLFVGPNVGGLAQLDSSYENLLQSSSESDAEKPKSPSMLDVAELEEMEYQEVERTESRR